MLNTLKALFLDPVRTNPARPVHPRPDRAMARGVLHPALMAAGLAAAICPSPALAQPVVWSANGHAYEVVATAAPICWTAAQADVNSRNGHLVTITSAQEQQFVDALLATANPPSGTVWIGLTEAGEGNYVWVTGEALTYTHWYPGEPNNAGGGEDRGSMLWTQGAPANGRSGLWNDAADCPVPGGCGGCDYGPARSYVIEYPCPPIFITQPANRLACPAGSATFSAWPAGIAPFTYQWQWQPTPGAAFINVAAGLNTDPQGGPIRFVAQNPQTAAVTLGNFGGTGIAQSHWDLRCIVTAGADGSCGSVTSDPATLTVSCPNKADVAGLGGTPGCDGQVTADDIVYYLAQFFASNASVADLVGLGGAGGPDGQITTDDLIAFLTAFFAACP